MEVGKLKSEVLKKFSENKSFLSSIDFWSQITGLEYFSFKVSQTTFQYMKGSSETKIIQQGVSSGKMAIIIEIPDIKLDDFILNRIEIIQDIEIKTSGMHYFSTTFETRKDFNTRNSLNQKPLRIFDARVYEGKVSLKFEVNKVEQIEVVSPL